MKNIAITFIIIVALSLSNCDLFDESVTVEYRVSGSADSVSLTYSVDGSTEQQTDVSPTWRHEFSAEPGDHVYISAQNEHDSGSVSTTISIDGDEFESATSEGSFVIATSSGSVPD